jgi:hypothetical protein
MAGNWQHSPVNSEGPLSLTHADAAFALYRRDPPHATTRRILFKTLSAPPEAASGAPRRKAAK